MTEVADTLNRPCSAGAERSAFFAESPSRPASRETNSAALPIRTCFHCGNSCDQGQRWHQEEKEFCCQGCLTVFELLSENGLDGYYRLGQQAGIRGRKRADVSQYAFVDEPAVRDRLVDFSNPRTTRVRFYLPAIHCIACVWLLENVFRLNPSIGHCQVNFPKKEVALAFDPAGVRLSEVIELLSSLGYEPDLKLSDVGGRPRARTSTRLWVQLGLAGFAFGNSMLFSIASYLGLDSLTGPAFHWMVGPIAFLLALPVVCYSAGDYWRSAWRSLQQRLLNIDVPIVAGIGAIFLQSTYEVFTGRGVGYFDSLCGLLFFLLCGKLFQEKTFNRLAFDRDYRSFFPLSAKRIGTDGEENIAVSQLAVGDRLRIRNAELLPADARLLSGSAMMDYSFVTGESEPVSKEIGESLYAGGRQMGGAIDVQTVKPVSQGYLTSLWNQDAFQKGDVDFSLETLTNRYSQRFTKLVVAVACGAAAFWAWANPSVALKAFTSVLIVACPCALALAAPFALGTAQRVLARRGVFLKNGTVLERLAVADTIVFDKTGTLTVSGGSVSFSGQSLNVEEAQKVWSLAQHSNHPLAVRLAQALGSAGAVLPLEDFREVPGRGMEAWVDGQKICLGSAAWFLEREMGTDSSVSSGEMVHLMPGQGSVVHLAVDGKHRGWFELTSALRPEVGQLLRKLGADYELALISGDNERDRPRFNGLFGVSPNLRFQQSPQEKLEFVRSRQRANRTVVMVGDGLNDAGALQQSDVGVAIVENLSAFSPASDVIMAAGMVPELGRVTAFAKSSVRVVRASFLISAVYNVIGIGIAARGWLAPVVCAVLMPLSSVTVVAFACGMTAWLGRRRLPSTVSIANRA